MTYHDPKSTKKTNEIPSVHHKYVTRCREAVQRGREVQVRYADEAVPPITYEQSHGQKDETKE